MNTLPSFFSSPKSAPVTTDPTMKLRLRSAAGQSRTLRFQLQSPATLLSLKSAVVSALSDSAAADPLAVKLSLNRRDELVADDPNAPLHSLGLTSGDLIYFTLDPDGFSPSSTSAPAQIASDGAISNSRGGWPVNSSSTVANPMEVGAIGGGGCGNMSFPRESSSLEPDCSDSVETTLDPSSKIDLESEDVERQAESSAPMEVEGSGIPDAMVADDEVVPLGKYVPLPSLLQKVLKDGGDKVRGNNVKLLVMVVHAVFLENGFVGYDSLARTAMAGSGLDHSWAASITTYTLKLTYTLPSLLALDCNSVNAVDLRFQILGKFVNIYGSVTGKGSRQIHLLLDASCYGPAIMFLWENRATLGNGNSSVTSHEKQFLELWKIVKDKLLLPLHIDICQKAGLPSPPCFMWLPTDIKIQILNLLPWMDLAKMACVCSEMNYLSSNDDLWKQHYGQEFGEVDMAGVTRWKDMFAVSVSRQKKMERETARRRGTPRRGFYGWLRRPVPFGGRGFIIGGDYDLIPGGSLSNNISVFRPRRFSPHGNFNGSPSLF